jgi:hypothetical protein
MNGIGDPEFHAILSWIRERAVEERTARLAAEGRVGELEAGITEALDFLEEIQFLW